MNEMGGYRGKRSVDPFSHPKNNRKKYDRIESRLCRVGIRIFGVFIFQILYTFLMRWIPILMPF